ncbi:MAG TPA: LUD domain-containing protein [Rhodocyclaceae bacterium]|nr:LUD domain-containing protein [Rhodocyclaceae bacterium]
MNARDRILRRLRAAPRGPSGPAPAVGDRYGRDPSTVGQRVDEFARQLTVSHAEVVISHAGAWAGQAAARLAERGVRRLLADWQDAAGQTLSRALPAAVERVAFDRPIEEWKEELFETVDAGFSVATAAVAATGTLVFASGPRAPRTLSLVPPLHVALVPAERLHADLYSAMSREGWDAALPTNLIMVSGPSKTADIQQTLAYGAHGPKELLVIVVAEGAPA